MAEYSKVIVRPKSIEIGSSSSSYYLWFGIDSINWTDTSPWEHIEIPAGVMIHQHLHSPHIRGEIKCYDLNSMYKALFSTVIDVYNKTAVNPDTMNKYNVEWFKINIVNERNEVTEIILDGFKVETIAVDNIKLGIEALWVVRFTADKLVMGGI